MVTNTILESFLPSNSIPPLFLFSLVNSHLQFTKKCHKTQKMWGRPIPWLRTPSSQFSLVVSIKEIFVLGGPEGWQGFSAFFLAFSQRKRFDLVFSSFELWLHFFCGLQRPPARRQECPSCVWRRDGYQSSWTGFIKTSHVYSVLKKR